MAPDLTHLQYPVGKLPQLPDSGRTPAQLEQFIQSMQQSVHDWAQVLGDLSPADLQKTYREGAFTVQQLAHHTADAHLHGLNRLRSGLTEDEFQIQPFAPADWVKLPDANLPVTVAVGLLEGLNAHWVALLQGTDPQQWSRPIVHPQEGRQDLWQLVGKHDWHLRHHLAHVKLALGKA